MIMIEQYLVKDIDTLEPGSYVAIDLIHLWENKSGMPLPPLALDEDEWISFTPPENISNEVWLNDKIFLRARYEETDCDTGLFTVTSYAKADDNNMIYLYECGGDGMYGASIVESVDEDRIVFTTFDWDENKRWWSLSRKDAEGIIYFPSGGASCEFFDEWFE